VALEARWLPQLAPTLPVAIPAVVATGRPAEGYPWAWAVHRWIDGENPIEGHLADAEPAWNLLPGSARDRFRDAVDVDDATWSRGRGWALAMAIIQLPYYRYTNPIISANARHVIREILRSVGAPG
jgi:aminoglycoside phosphotransferase (APT) family kinase protein